MKAGGSISRGMVAAAGLATLLSGAAGLSYEVLWSRMLVVPLGNSADATALVLCAFMLGMAAGARIIGALADRIPSPLRLYVAAEALLAVYAVAMPFITPALLGGTMAWAGKMILGVVLVAIPAFLMGASVPVLVRGLSTRADHVPLRVGLLYGLNTLGGAAGAALAGFLAVPSLGLTAASMLAAAGSIAAALLVAAVAKLSRLGSKGKTETVPETDDDDVPRAVAVAALAAAAAGGFVMLGAEVIWARLLTFVFGHDTYAFAILLVVVLAGMGLGGAAHRAFLSKRDPARVVPALLGLLLASFCLSYQGATHIIVGLGRDPFSLGELTSLSTSLWTEFYRELLFTLRSSSCCRPCSPAPSCPPRAPSTRGPPPPQDVAWAPRSW